MEALGVECRAESSKACPLMLSSTQSLKESNLIFSLDAKQTQITKKQAMIRLEQINGRHILTQFLRIMYILIEFCRKIVKETFPIGSVNIPV